MYFYRKSIAIFINIYIYIYIHNDIAYISNRHYHLTCRHNYMKSLQFLSSSNFFLCVSFFSSSLFLLLSFVVKKETRCFFCFVCTWTNRKIADEPTRSCFLTLYFYLVTVIFFFYFCSLIFFHIRWRGFDPIILFSSHLFQLSARKWLCNSNWCRNFQH